MNEIIAAVLVFAILEKYPIVVFERQFRCCFQIQCL